MLLHQFTKTQIRESCKETIENLELWLRRIIDYTLSSKFGTNYLNAKLANGNNIIKKEIREKIEERRQSEPDRFPRKIDAMMLNEEIDIICNQNLYKDYFKDFFKYEYDSFSKDNIRFLLENLLKSRNHLYHSNPINIHQAEQIFCYSSEVITSIKKRFEELGMDREYNVPIITKVSDLNSALEFYDSGISRSDNGTGIVNLREYNKTKLYSGDTLNLEIEVDPTFSVESYQINWQIPELGEITNRISTNECHVIPNGHKSQLILQLEDKHIRQDFRICCRVISTDNTKTWQRCGNCEDLIVIIYKILPILSKTNPTSS